MADVSRVKRKHLYSRFRCNTVPEEEYWCHKPEGLLHGRRSVQYLSIVIGAAFGGRWTTMGLRIRLHLGGGLGRPNMSRGPPKVVFRQAERGRCCCFCVQGMLRRYYGDIVAACGRLCCFFRRLRVRVRVSVQNSEPPRQLPLCCLCLP